METLTRQQAHDLIDAAINGGTADDLRDIARQWELAGSWNDMAEWSADDLHQHVEDVACPDDDKTPRPSDPTGLPGFDSTAQDRATEEGDHYAAPWPISNLSL